MNFQHILLFRRSAPYSDFLNKTWTKYKEGEVDLLTGTIVKNAALDIVRREEIEITAYTFPELSEQGKLSYNMLAGLIFFAESLAKGNYTPAMSAKSLKITPFDNFIYLPVARTLMRFEQVASTGTRVSSIAQISLCSDAKAMRYLYHHKS